MRHRRTVSPGDRPEVFIASSTEQKDAARALAQLLAECGFRPKCWFDQDVFELGGYTFEALEEINSYVQAAVVVFGEDDESWYHGSLNKRARDNAVLEYGLFSGTHGRQRTLFVRVGEPRLPTDLDGITYASFDPGSPHLGAERIRIWAERLLRPAQNPAVIRSLRGEWLMKWTLSDGSIADEVLSLDEASGRVLTGQRSFNGQPYALTGYCTDDSISLASASEDLESPAALTLFLHAFDTDELRGREVFKAAGGVVSADVVFRRRPKTM
jgi:hypothetical protein